MEFGRRVLIPTLLLSISSVVWGGPLTDLTWTTDERVPDRHTLGFVFDGAPPDFEVWTDADGLRIRLSDPSRVAGALPDGIRIDPAEHGSLVTVAGRDVRVVAFRGDGGRLSMTVVVPSARPDGEYRLGAGDVVTVAIYEDKSLSGDYTVGQDGAINLPLVGPIPSVGLTDRQLTDAIRQRIGEFIDTPTVSVTIRAFQSQSVVVNVVYTSGTAVLPRAVKIPIRPGMGFADVLAEAGVALLPGQPVELRREGVPGDSPIRLTLDRLHADGAVPAPRDGDVLNVGEPPYVFVRGEVRRPGRYLHGSGMTLQQLLSVCEGLTDWASRKDIRIQRRDPDGSTEKTYNLRRIEAGQDPDPVLGPGDLIIVQRRVL